MTNPTTAIIRAHMRQQAAQRRPRRRKQAKRLPYPSGLRTAYLTQLRAMIAKVEMGVRQERDTFDRILTVTRAQRGDAARQDDIMIDVTKELLGRIQELLVGVFAADQIEAIARTLLRRLDAQHTVAIAQQLEGIGLVPINVFGNEPWLETLMEAAIQENVGLIKDIGAEMSKRIEGSVMRTIREGHRVEQLMKELRTGFDMSRRRAALIATDQVGKAQGQLNQLRQQDAGIGTYTWSTSRDERVRSSHAALDGEQFSWKNPPVVDPRTGRTAHPGGDYRCRCSAIPVLPDL